MQGFNPFGKRSIENECLLPLRLLKLISAKPSLAPFLLLLHLSFNGRSHVDEFSAGIFIVIIAETLNSKVVRPPIEHQGIVIGLLILWVKPGLF